VVLALVALVELKPVQAGLMAQQILGRVAVEITTEHQAQEVLVL